MSWREWKSDPIYYARESLLVVFAVSALSLTCVAAPIYILYGCYRSYFPADRVTVQIQNIADDVDFVCVVGDTDDGPRALDWYQGGGMFGPHTSSATSGYASDPREHRGTPPDISDGVRWIHASRYGVLTRDRQRVWRVYWFTTDEAKLQTGNWTARLPDMDKGEAPSADFLKEIGISSTEGP
jgi:hypothetical protein